MWKTSILAVAALALVFPTAESRAAELVIFSPGSMSEPVKEIGEAFTLYVVGVSWAVKAQDAARAFVAFAQTPESQAKLRVLGVQPAARTR